MGKGWNPEEHQLWKDKEKGWRALKKEEAEGQEEHQKKEMMWKPSRRSVSIQQELSTDCNEWRVFYEKWEKENALEKVKP